MSVPFLRSVGRRAAGVAALALVTVVAACSAPPTWQSPTGAGPTGSTNPPSATATTTPPTTGPTSAPPSDEDSCVATTLAGLDLAHQVGQVVMVGTPLSSPSGVTTLARTYGIGGIFLQGRSHAAAATLKAQIAALQATAPAGDRYLIALDQEGGEVQTLQGTDFPPIPTAVDQGKLSQSDLRALSTRWSGRLAAIGVTLDLAPVADTVPASLGTGNPPIGAFLRQYGSDPTKVSADITTVVTAIQGSGVLTTLKHFPGLGRVRQNTDTSTGAVDSTATTHDPYLAPFQAGISAGTAAVMISSASYPHLDAHAIAAFSSPIVTGLLRQQLGFTGLIVSDDLGNAVAASAVPVGQRGVRFLQAGGDLVLTVSASTATPMLDGLLAAARGSTTFAATVRAAAAQVLHAKYTAGLLGCSPHRS